MSRASVGRDSCLSDIPWLVLTGLLALFGGSCGCTDISCRETLTCPSTGPGAATQANLPDASMAAEMPGNGGTGNGATAPSPSSICPQGEHRCAGVCVSNADPQTCGASCTPCQAPVDGAATCDGIRCGGDCGSGQLCAGECIAAGMACERSCAEATHECNGLCPPVSSVNACGTSCDPCPVPESATQASCNGQECGFVCQPGYHRCGDTCKRDTDVTACGNSCTPCPNYDNGFAACNDGICTVWCNTGFHVCDEACVPDDSPLTCGSACDPCTVPAGGEAVCQDGVCAGSCPDNQKLCAGACIDEGAACSGLCAEGTHNCDEVCVLDTNPTQCGAACVACPVPVGAARATCVDGECGITGCRDTGFRRCGDECFVVDDEDHCGAGCVACPSDPNDPDAERDCIDDQCVNLCSAGFHGCDDGLCHANDDTFACGATCQICPVPEGGATSCVAGNCVPHCPDPTLPQLCNGVCIASDAACAGDCPEGTHPCAGFCRNDADTGACGLDCFVCTEPTSGDSTCEADSAGVFACGISCEVGFHPCDGETCESDDNAQLCGLDCEACPDPLDGEPRCIAGACDIVCLDDFHRCEGTSECAADRDPNNCGPTCETCSGTTPVCLDGACAECDPSGITQRCQEGLRQVCGTAANTFGTWVSDPCPITQECNPATGTCRCAPGFHQCGTECVSNTAPQTCGARCSDVNPCPVPNDGAAICNVAGVDGTASTCGITCVATFHPCSGGSCAADDDASRCGSSCLDCPEPTAGIGQAICTGGSCAIRCDNGLTPVAGACPECPAGQTFCAGTCCGGDTPFCNGTQCGECSPQVDETACGTCETCSPSGACAAVASGTDPGNDCASSPLGSAPPCFTGQCAAGGCATVAATTCGRDADADRYYNPGDVLQLCGCPAGRIDTATFTNGLGVDCNDTDAASGQVLNCAVDDDGDGFCAGTPPVISVIVFCDSDCGSARGPGGRLAATCPAQADCSDGDDTMGPPPCP